MNSVQKYAKLVYLKTIKFLSDSTSTVHVSRNGAILQVRNLPMQQVRNPQILIRGLASRGEALDPKLCS